MSVVKIASDGGQVRAKTWTHASVRAELTNATPEEVERVRQLVQSIVALMTDETPSREHERTSSVDSGRRHAPCPLLAQDVSRTPGLRLSDATRIGSE